MDPRRSPHEEMVDTEKNRSVLGTFTPELLRAARYSLIKAEYYGNEPKTRHILAYLGDTTGLNGQGRADLRDAVAPARPQTPGLGGAPTAATGTARSGAAW